MTKEALKLALGYVERNCPALVFKEIKEALALTSTQCEVQPEQEPPSEWAGIKAILDEYGLQAIDFVADFKAALAQPVQEPEVVSKAKFNRLQDDYNDLFNRALQDAKHAKAWRAHVNNCQLQGVDLDFKPPLTAQPEQEPVAWMHEWDDGERIPLMHSDVSRDNDEPVSVRPLVYGDAHEEPVAWATREDFYLELDRRVERIRKEMEIKTVTMRCKDYDIALQIIDMHFGHVFVGQVSTQPKRPWVGLTDEFCITNMFDMGHYSLQIVFKSRKNADEFKAALKELNA